jgi:hypothetical protein
MADHTSTTPPQSGTNSMVAPAGTVAPVPASPSVPAPTPSQGSADGSLNDARIAEYEQVGSQFRALTDIRFKLLGFLPVGTIATVLAAKDASLIVEQAVAAFGLAVTLCIATYNKRNDQLYNELVSRAAELERELLLQRGSFAQRPTTWLSFGPWKVEHGWPIGFIYAASTSIWTYVLIHAATPDLFQSWRGMSYGPVWPWLGVVVVIIAWQLLRAWERSRADALEVAILKLQTPFAGQPTEELTKVLAGNRQLRALFRRPGKAAKKIERRLSFQAEALMAARASGPNYAALSLVLSNVIDLPARWIHDVWTGRR